MVDVLMPRAQKQIDIFPPLDKGSMELIGRSGGLDEMFVFFKQYSECLFFHVPMLYAKSSKHKISYPLH